jgi:hypothetical protein
MIDWRWVARDWHMPIQFQQSPCVGEGRVGILREPSGGSPWGCGEGGAQARGNAWGARAGSRERGTGETWGRGLRRTQGTWGDRDGIRERIAGVLTGRAWW